MTAAGDVVLPSLTVLTGVLAAAGSRRVWRALKRGVAPGLLAPHAAYAKSDTPRSYWALVWLRSMPILAFLALAAMWASLGLGAHAPVGGASAQVADARR